jgi:hypothetical protein
MRKLLIVAVFWLLPLAEAAPPKIIATKAATPDTVPAFITVSELVTPDGEFSPSVPKAWRTMMSRSGVAAMAERDRQVDTNPDLPCGGAMWTEPDVEYLPGMATAPQILRGAKGIYQGRIASITPGFFYGSPGSLLEVEGMRTIKFGQEYVAIQDRLYVGHPYAHFRIGPLEFCSETRTDVAPIPAVGDEIIVFALTPPGGDAGTYVHALRREMIIGSEGKLHVPDYLRPVAARATSVGEVATHVREMLDSSRAAERDRQ